MISRQVERHPFTIFILVTAFVLCVWLGAQLIFSFVLRIFNFNNSIDLTIDALSTALAAAAFVSGALIASKQLGELAKARHMEIADKLFNELNSSESIAARRWVFQHLPDDPVEGMRTLTPEGREAVKDVLNSLDRVAFLTQNNWIPEDMVMLWINPMIVKSWIKLGPYVEYERNRRNEPEYYEMARKLADHCINWRNQRMSESPIQWPSDAL